MHRSPVAPGLSAAGRAILPAIRELAPVLADRALEVERGRALPRDIVELLRAAHVFRMLVPERFGGSALDVITCVDVLTELAATDGSVGWTVMIGSHAPLMFSLLPEATLEAIYANGPDVIGGGASIPKGRAHRVEGGFTVSGRWPFVSGCQHADWLFAVCATAEVGESPRVTRDGRPELRFIALPAPQWTIVDTWQSMGLRGTGSHDIVLTDVFIPEARTASFASQGARDVRDPVLFMPHHQMALHLGAIAIGIAQGAIADLVKLGQSGKRRMYATRELADTTLFQYHLGRAEVGVLAARALLREQAELLWRQMSEFHIEPELAARIPQSVVWIADACERAVDLCFRTAGASALFESSPLQRRLRDIHTLTQHFLLQESGLVAAGARLVKRPPGG